ncbi:MAG: hypothetical protein MUD16_03580 [Desulfobacterales bacterium]|jgi:hypothetical protein|nr:hypothetical protein [Desulfobacterales bacterium]
MTAKIIAIEEMLGPLRGPLGNIMRMVPDRDQHDVNLLRLLAFRLRIDGEAALKDYLLSRIRDAIQCGYSGSLYDFLKRDPSNAECPTATEEEPADPGAA